MLLSEALLLEVPNGLAAEHAALTEPLAVGVHAVAKANIRGGEVPLVIGCGPVGLAVIAALKIKGMHPIVAADYSPARRALAEKLGADIVVDPARSQPYATWAEHAQMSPEEKAARPPLQAMLPALKPALIFECVGVPGLIQQVFEGAPRDARIVVVGVCMETDRAEPMLGIMKELNVQYVLGYTPEEFAYSLRLIAEGQVDAASMVTASVGIDGVAKAFADLANPEAHTKIIVEPWRSFQSVSLEGKGALAPCPPSISERALDGGHAVALSTLRIADARNDAQSQFLLRQNSSTGKSAKSLSSPSRKNIPLNLSGKSAA